MMHIKHAQIEYRKHLRDSGKSAHTIRSYERNLNYLIDFLLELKKEHVHLVTKEDLEKFIERIVGKQSAKSINSRAVALKSFFKFLEVNEYITQNPAAALKYLKEEESKPRILSIVEYRALRDAAKNDPRYSAIIELMLQTGIKIGEVSRIRLEDIKLENGGKLSIRDEDNKISRIVPLNSPARKAVELYLEKRPGVNPVRDLSLSGVKNDILFVTKNGKAIDPRNIRLAVSKYYKKAGIVNARVHDLRHTFCAHHIKKGTSLVAIAYMAGHKNLNTTKKYLEFLEKPSAEDLEKNAL